MRNVICISHKPYNKEEKVMPKTVIITGASRGIGKEIAKLFAENGYNVLLNYNKSSKMAEITCKKLQELGYSVKLFKADVSNREEVNSMIEYCLQEFGSIDVVINNAGVTYTNLFTETTLDKWNEVMSINLNGAFNVTQEALKKYMLSNKNGSIINISSIDGISGSSCEVAYSTSKAGIIGMTKALAKELAMSNVTVNAIAPGAISTDMLYDNYEESDLEIVKDEIPMKRFGTPEEIAELAYFLASDKARYITGQVISPNGGSVI